jgi:predicted RNase H-like HicB family nuclease
MTMYVLIETTPEGAYTASLIGLPTIKAQGSTEDEAIRCLRRLLAEQLKDVKLVPFELGGEQPWLHTAGMFKDDPFADELDAVIADYRRELDAEDLRPDTQDHAA